MPISDCLLVQPATKWNSMLESERKQSTNHSYPEMEKTLMPVLYNLCINRFSSLPLPHKGQLEEMQGKGNSFVPNWRLVSKFSLVLFDKDVHLTYKVKTLGPTPSRVENLQLNKSGWMRGSGKRFIPLAKQGNYILVPYTDPGSTPFSLT